MTPVAPNAATVVAAVPVVSYVPPSVTMSGNGNTTMPVAVMPVAQMPTVAPAVSSNLNALTALMQNNGLDPTASYPVTTFLIFYSQIVGSGNAPNTADLGFGNNDVVTLTQFWNALSGYTNGLSGMGRMKAWKL
jgi:hypothetical protein